MGDEETEEDMLKRVEATTGDWDCLVKNAKKLAKAHKKKEFTKVAKILEDCGVSEEDMAYYMKALWDCRLGRSW